MIAIAYLIPGDFGNRLGQASSQLLAATISSYKKGLNALLNFEVIPVAAFPISDLDLFRYSGYASLAYTRDVIRKDYQEGTDYIVIEKRMYLTLDAVAIALNAARSNKGCEVPDAIKQHPFPWDKLHQRDKIKINRRRVQDSEPTIPGFELA